jgi:hypothetical protein
MSKGMAEPGGLGCGNFDGILARSIGIGYEQNEFAIALTIHPTRVRRQIHRRSIVITLEINSSMVGWEL